MDAGCTRIEKRALAYKQYTHTHTDAFAALGLSEDENKVARKYATLAEQIT